MERLPEVQASWAAFVELRGRASFIVGEGFLSWQGKAAWAPKSRVSSISEEPAPFQIVLGARNSLTSRLELRFFAKAMERGVQSLRLPRSSASWWNSISPGRISILRKAETL